MVKKICAMIYEYYIVGGIGGGIGFWLAFAFIYIIFPPLPTFATFLGAAFIGIPIGLVIGTAMGYAFVSIIDKVSGVKGGGSSSYKSRSSTDDDEHGPSCGCGQCGPYNYG